MIRFYRQYAKQLLAMLVYFKERFPDSWADASGMATAGHVSGNDIVDTLQEQVDTEATEPDLIDKVVQILGLPHLENRIGAAVIAKLRKALMLPAEIRQVQQMMDESWFCTNCRAPFTGGDVLTVRQVVANGQNILVIYCSRCIDPAYIRCKSSKHHRIPLSTGFTRALRKCLDAECVECRHEAEETERRGVLNAGASVTLPMPPNPMAPTWVVESAAAPLQPFAPPGDAPQTTSTRRYQNGRIEVSIPNPWRTADVANARSASGVVGRSVIDDMTRLSQQMRASIADETLRLDTNPFRVRSVDDEPYPPYPTSRLEEDE